MELGDSAADAVVATERKYDPLCEPLFAPVLVRVHDGTRLKDGRCVPAIE